MRIHKEPTPPVTLAAAHPVPPLAVRCHLSVVTSNTDFDLLEDRWNALLSRADATIFQTFEWTRTWWKHFSRPSYRLNILLFTYEGQLVGIAPMFLERVGVPGLRLFARLQMLGRGLSDYVDFIMEPGYEQIILGAFAIYLRSTTRDWDLLDIEDVTERSPLVRDLPSILEHHGIMVYRYQGNVCPRLPLTPQVNPPEGNGGPTGTYNFKRKFKKLQQSFRASVRLYRSDKDDIEQGLKEFAYVHGQRWKSQGYPSAFDDPSLMAFHVEFSRRFARRGWLRLFVLSADDTPVALHYGFNYRDCIYMYHSNAHGPEEVMKCSPGFLIRSIAMADGMSEGMKIFDFLRGDEAYKYREWKAIDTKNYLIRASSPGRLSRARFTAFLFTELLGKCRSRLQREYYEYRRFRIVQPRSRGESLKYILSRTGKLLILGYNFIVRHAPLRSIQKLQLPQRESEVQDAERDLSDQAVNRQSPGNGQRKDPYR